MEKIRLDYSKADKFINESEIDYIKDMVIMAHNMIHKRTGAGNDF